MWFNFVATLSFSGDITVMKALKEIEKDNVRVGKAYNKNVQSKSF